MAQNTNHEVGIVGILAFCFDNKRGKTSSYNNMHQYAPEDNPALRRNRLDWTSLENITLNAI